MLECDITWPNAFSQETPERKPYWFEWILLLSATYRFKSSLTEFSRAFPIVESDVIGRYAEVVRGTSSGFGIKHTFPMFKGDGKRQNFLHAAINQKEYMESVYDNFSSVYM